MATRSSVYEIRVEAIGITSARDQIASLSKPATSAAIAVNALRSSIAAFDQGALGTVANLLKVLGTSSRSIARTGGPAGAALTALAAPLRTIGGINLAAAGRDMAMLGRAMPAIARNGFTAAAALNVMIPPLEALAQIPTVFITRDMLNLSAASSTLARTGFRGGASMQSLAVGLSALSRIQIDPALGSNLLSVAPGITAMASAIKGFGTKGGSGAAASINSVASALVRLNAVGLNPALTAQLQALGPVLTNLNRQMVTLGRSNVAAARQGTTATTLWSQAFGKLGKQMGLVSESLGFLRSALVVFASIGFIRQATDYIDSFTIMRNRVKIFARDQDTANAVLSQLVAISNETRTAIMPNVELFGRMARAVSGMGKSYREVLDVVRLTSMAIQISGATTAEAQNAIIQFSQGLAAGALRGDELRSVVEQMPRLSQAIADGLTTIGNKYPEIKKVVDTLRKPGVAEMGKELKIAGGQLAAFAKKNPGILTTKFLFEAILASSKEMVDEFRQTTPTIGSAFTVLDNALRVFIGITSEATGVGVMFADAILVVAKNVDLLFLGLGTLATVFAFNFLTSQLAFFLATLSRGGATVFSFLNFATLGFGRLILAVGALPVTVVKAVYAVGQGIIAIGTGIKTGILLIATTTRAAATAVYASFMLMRGGAIVFSAGLAAMRAAVIGAVAGLALLRATGGAVAVLTTLLSAGFRGAAVAAATLGTALFRGMLAFFMNPFVLGAVAVVTAIYVAFTYLSDKVKELGGIFNTVKVIFNTVVSGIYAGVMTIWDGFSLLGPAIGEMFVNMANFVLRTIEGLVNSIIDGINSVLAYAVFAMQAAQGNVNPDLLNPENGAIGKIDLGKLETDYAGSGEKLGKIFSDHFNSAMGADPLGSVINGVQDLGKTVADLLSGKGGGLLDTIIGGDQNFADMSGGGDKKTKGLKQVTKAMRDLEESLSPALALTNRLEEAQKTYNNAIKAGVKPRMDYSLISQLIIRDELGVGNAAFDAKQKIEILDAAFRKNKVTADEYTTALTKVRIEALGAKTDIASGLAAGLMEVGLKMSDQASKMKDSVTGMFDKIKGPMQQHAYDLAALKGLYENNAITASEYDYQLRSIGQSVLDLKVEMGDATFAESFLAGIGKMSGGVTSFVASAGAEFGNFFSTLASGFGNSVGRAIVFSEDLGAALLDVARNAVAELIGALINIGIQYLINATIGEAIASAATAASVAQATIVAGAWAPAAAAVSLASFGTNAIPAMAGIAATNGLAAALAAAGGGMKDGGVVRGPGTSTSDETLRALSNGEFVVNARQTKRHLGLLHAINDNTPLASVGAANDNSIPQSTAAVAFGGGRRGLGGDVSSMGHSAEMLRSQPTYNNSAVHVSIGDTHISVDASGTGGDPKQIASAVEAVAGPMVDRRVNAALKKANRGGGINRNPGGRI